MHLPHSHLPWLLQMPWEERGDTQHPRAIADTQRHWGSMSCHLPVALSFEHGDNLLQPWSGCPPHRQGSTYPSAVDAGVIARGTFAARALPAALAHARALGAATAICKRQEEELPRVQHCPAPLALSAAPPLFGGGLKELQTDPTASSLQAQSPRRWSLNPLCQCHQDRAVAE